MDATLKLVSLVIILSCISGCKSKQNSPAASSPPATTANSPSSPATAPSSTTTTYASAAKAKTDACAMLTSAEIQAVQQEAVKETKLSGASEGGFSVSQCFFTLPTFTNSISLQVTQKGEGAGARDPKEFWRDTFHREAKSEREPERDKGGRKEEEDEKDVAPQKVSGVGDEAFWMGSHIGGALYVLKGDQYIRISVGGPGNQAEKIKKSTALAQKALARL